MSSRLRLGYLVPSFPGQTHTSAWSEIAALEERGVDVTILSTHPPDVMRMPHDWGRIAQLRTHYLTEGAPFAFLRGLPALPARAFIGGERGFARQTLGTLGPAATLAAIARRDGFRHVHVQGAGEGALIAALARRLGGPSYSIHLSGPLSDGGAGQNLKWQDARFATVATARILNEIRFVLRGDLPERVTIRPVGVDTTFFRREGAYAAPRRGEMLRLVACGALAPAKGFDDLLKAVRRILDLGHDLRLVIAGEEAANATGYREAIATHIADLRLTTQVTLAGAVDSGALREMLRKAHVFVLPSWHEPLGTALMEAMACGVPSVATAAGGVRELASDGRDVLLVRPKAPDELARAVLRIADDPELGRHLSTLARARIEAEFDAGRAAEHLMREAGFWPMDHDAGLMAGPPQSESRQTDR